MLEQRKHQLHKYVVIARSVIGDELIQQDELDQTHFKYFRKAVNTKFRNLEIDLDKALLRQLIIAVGRRYNVKFPDLKVAYKDLENGAAALIVRRSGQWIMEFNTRFAHDETRLTMMVAHELAHIVLHQKAIMLEPRIRNEELTDTVAIMAGFGSIYKAGQLGRVKQRSGLFALIHPGPKQTMGYLSRADIDYLLAEKAKIRKQADHTALRSGDEGYVPPSYTKCAGITTCKDQTKPSTMENNKQALLAESERRLRQIYRSLAAGHKFPEQERTRLSGFMQAGIFLGLVDRKELNELVGRVHLEELGETVEERRERKAGEWSSVQPDYSHYDVPTFERLSED